jgi:demethylmenaquinone methyltransferase/2-methoxy-6-polyprenyl-1,4-benzoquinol methylase
MLKKQETPAMFDGIAHRYDFLNHLLSAGIDRRWRRKLIRSLSEARVERVLDVATGTADLALMAARAGIPHISAIDPSDKMLAIAEKKRQASNAQDQVVLKNGRAEKLPFSDASFDAVMVAFGVRNFEDLTQGMKEMQRVLRPGGMLCILEFSQPAAFPLKQIYAAYFRLILPLIGGWISGDNKAYRYLRDSVLDFPAPQVFLGMLAEAGFRKLKEDGLSAGIVSLYTAVK